MVPVAKRPTSAPGRLTRDQIEIDQESDAEDDLGKFVAANHSELPNLHLMVDERQIKMQASMLHKQQFLRGVDQWDMRLDPDYQEFYIHKQHQERNVCGYKFLISLSTLTLTLSFLSVDDSSWRKFGPKLVGSIFDAAK